MSPYSSAEVARIVGIHLRTLERWLEDGKVKPDVLKVGKKNYRIWTPDEIEKVRTVKKRTYMKGRGRKKRKK